MNHIEGREGQSVYHSFIRTQFTLSTMLLPLLFLILPLISTQLQTRSCMTCASEGLRSRWFLTGLPTSSIIDSQFTSDCDGGISNSIQREPCSGPCYTYMFDDPDSRGDTPTVLFVRGCHDQMVGVVSDRLTSGGTQNGVFCEYDSSYSRPDSRGKIVSSKTLVEFCGTQEDACNKRSRFPSTSGVNDICTGSQYNNTLNGSPLYCYECSKNDWNCNENRCYKKYCGKSVVSMGNSYSIRKTCSNVNLLGLDNSCAYTDIVDTAGDISLNMKYTMCMCKDKQYCNSSPSFSSIFILLLSTLFSLQSTTLFIFNH
ncbi:hypothetical protein PRIPAC_80260 [Pristionchus pacificus]|uniref:Uncharacterized protein n=1 Tax=Pristionchus pacificus TaxID=54126 RepID=A0A2A6BYT9_PRIPA|nr:hypothetical protein PRIPAC_80260 [Pristionchus pacificus]|eukprot:PDM71060.1 hypothetical protein PRIPAC_44456 [Pristionchus pacificus]